LEKFSELIIRQLEKEKEDWQKQQWIVSFHRFPCRYIF
jgi:hypothetical protein